MLGCGLPSAEKAVTVSAIWDVKPFESLRLDHDKVRNEFESYCLVQYQVPGL